MELQDYHLSAGTVQHIQRHDGGSLGPGGGVTLLTRQLHVGKVKSLGGAESRRSLDTSDKMMERHNGNRPDISKAKWCLRRSVTAAC